MKFFSKSILLIFIIFNVLLSCNSKSNKETVVVKQSDIVRTHIGVKGMTCVGCEVTLEHSLTKIIGVVNAKASANKNEAVIEFDQTKTNQQAIEKEISKVGYEVYPLKQK